MEWFYYPALVLAFILLMYSYKIAFRKMSKAKQEMERRKKEKEAREKPPDIKEGE